MTEVEKKAYEYFKKTREERGLTLSDASNALHLTVSLIEKMEAGDFNHQHLAPVFMRGYIRAYTKYLGLTNDIAEEILKELVIQAPINHFPEKTETQEVTKNAPRNMKKIILYFIVVALLALIGFMWHTPKQATVQKIAMQTEQNTSSRNPSSQETPDNIAEVPDNTANEPANIPPDTALPTTEEKSTTTPASTEQNALPATLTPSAEINTLEPNTPPLLDEASSIAASDTPGIAEKTPTTPPEVTLQPLTPPNIPPVVTTPPSKKPANNMTNSASSVPVENAQEVI